MCHAIGPGTIAVPAITVSIDSVLVPIADEIHEVQNCAICHGALQQGYKRRLTMPKRLPCGHVFHLGCVRRWMIHSLGKEATCPMCRLQLPNALEAQNAECWQAKAAAGIRWWLDWPRQHAVSVCMHADPVALIDSLPAQVPAPSLHAAGTASASHVL